MVYEANWDKPIVSYVDASFADAHNLSYRSTGGYLVFLYRDLVVWNTKRLKRTATSTTKAEYIALNDAYHNVSFLRALHREECGSDNPAIIFEDKSSTICIAKGIESSLSCFLLTKEYAIRETVQNSEIEICKVTSVEQYADILTKALDEANFEQI